MAETVLAPEVLSGEQPWGAAHTRLEIPTQPTTYPGGTVVIISADLTRYAAFSQSLLSLTAPAGSEMSWSRGVNIAQNLNNAMAQLHGEWVWFMGDDHIFAPDTLLRLLAHGVDVVAPLCLLRQPPYAALVFRRELEDGSFEVWPPAELPQHGLHPIAAAGSAGLLLRRRVIESLERPYFETGKIRKDELGEDLYLYHKIAQAGFQAYIDCDTMIGHITPTALWPARTPDGTWDISLDPTCTIPPCGNEGP